MRVPIDVLRFAPGSRPRLIVTVDAEEEFDWGRFAADQRQVRNIAEQWRADAIFAGFGCVPTYLVDHPVASQPEAYLPLRQLLEQGRCLIGAQLHPWVTPPIAEDVVTDQRHTFPGNLSATMERAKLQTLSSVIAENFGSRPIIYRAGRYGIGDNTVAILGQLGFRIDMSVLPKVNFEAIGGPCYDDFDTDPFWLDPGLLEIPLTSAYSGGLASGGDWLYPRIDSRLGRLAKIPAIMAQLGLLNRVRLSPEGQSQHEAQRLTQALINRGVRLFTISYHSSSLLPGGNPFVGTAADVDRLLAWLSRYLEFFIQQIGGELTTPEVIYREALERCHAA